MILKIEATDPEARNAAAVAHAQANGAIIDAEAAHQLADIAYKRTRNLDLEIGGLKALPGQVQEQLDVMRMGLNNRGREIKMLDGLMKNLQEHVARELTKVPAVVAKNENIQINTDFAAQFGMQLNKSDQELANIASGARQLAHRLHLVEGQRNALALGVPTESGRVLQTNVTAAGQDIRQLRADFNGLERQFIEMRAAIGEALLTKPSGVSDVEVLKQEVATCRRAFNSTTQQRAEQETRIKDLEVRMGNVWDELEQKANKRNRSAKK